MVDYILTIRPLNSPLADPAAIAIISVILTSICAYIVNLIVEERKNKNILHRSQRQAYSQLKGRRDEISPIYKSLIMARLQSEMYKTLLNNYKPTIAKGMSEQIKYEQKIARDDLNKEYYRQRETADNRIVDIARSQGDLMETVGLIKFLFDKTEKLDKYLSAIEHNNHAFPNFIEKDIIGKAIKKFDEDLKKIPMKNRKNMKEIDPDTINQLSDSLIKSIEGTVENDIKKYIRDPIDILLQYMQEKIDNKENDARQIRNVEISP